MRENWPNTGYGGLYLVPPALHEQVRDIIKKTKINWTISPLRKPAGSYLANPVVTTGPNMICTRDDLHPQIAPLILALQNPHPCPAENTNTLHLLAARHC